MGDHAGTDMSSFGTVGRIERLMERFCCCNGGDDDGTFGPKSMLQANPPDAASIENQQFFLKIKLSKSLGPVFNRTLF